MALFVLSYRERKVLLFILSLMILGFGIKFLYKSLHYPSVQALVPQKICVDINKASFKQLLSLPGIGRHLAAEIIKRRLSEPFTKPEDLLEVKGIGIKKLQRIRNYLCPHQGMSSQRPSE